MNTIDELMSRQLKDVSYDRKLGFSDMKRICKYADKNIFDKRMCCLWKGYITNKDETDKGAYVNFFFRNSKTTLHRLLYVNFVGKLNDGEYLRFCCENKGKCCNIHHVKKFIKPQKKPKKQQAEQHNKQQKNKTINNTMENPDLLSVPNTNPFCVSFD